MVRWVLWNFLKVFINNMNFYIFKFTFGILVEIRAFDNTHKLITLTFMEICKVIFRRVKLDELDAFIHLLEWSTCIQRPIKLKLYFDLNVIHQTFIDEVFVWIANFFSVIGFLPVPFLLRSKILSAEIWSGQFSLSFRRWSIF